MRQERSSLWSEQMLKVRSSPWDTKQTQGEIIAKCIWKCLCFLHVLNIGKENESPLYVLALSFQCLLKAWHYNKRAISLNFNYYNVSFVRIHKFIRCWLLWGESDVCQVVCICTQYRSVIHWCLHCFRKKKEKIGKHEFLLVN